MAASGPAATQEQKRRARLMAFYSTLVVAAFAAAFLGLTYFLDHVAATSHDDAQIEGASTTLEPIDILLIGSDSRKGTAFYTGKQNESSQVDQYADIITLMRVDPTSHIITLVTIPRDTRIAGEQQKINAYLRTGEPEQVVDAVERLTGVRPDYYMMTTFTAFEDLVDALGGVTVDVPKTIKLADARTAKDVSVKAGDNVKINGAQALVLARTRKPYEGNQDGHRQVNVRALEKAIIEKVCAQGADLDVERILEIAEETTTTDMNPALTALLVKEFAEHADEITFYEATGPYEGGIPHGEDEWVVYYSPQTWAAIMAKVEAGEDPSTVNPAPTF